MKKQVLPREDGRGKKADSGPGWERRHGLEAEDWGRLALAGIKAEP